MTDTIPAPRPSEIPTDTDHEIPSKSFRDEIADILGNVLDVKLASLLELPAKVDHLEGVLAQSLANFELASREFHKIQEQGNEHEGKIVALTRRVDALERELEDIRTELPRRIGHG